MSLNGDAYADYLRKRVAKSKAIDRRYQNSYRKSLEENESINNNTSTSTDDDRIQLKFDDNKSPDDERDYSLELQNMLQEYFTPDVASRITENHELPDPMKEIIIDNFYTDFAPRLETYKGKSNIKMSTILSLLKRTANEISNVEQEAIHNQQEIKKNNNIWSDSKKHYSLDEKEAFASLVFQAKAIHNQHTIKVTNDPTTLNKEDIALTMAHMVMKDNNFENLRLAGTKVITTHYKLKYYGYVANPDQQTISETFKKFFASNKQIGAPELQTIYKLYWNEVFTYQSLLRNPIGNFNLAKEIFQYERPELKQIIDELLIAKPVILTDGSVVALLSKPTKSPSSNASTPAAATSRSAPPSASASADPPSLHSASASSASVHEPPSPVSPPRASQYPATRSQTTRGSITNYFPATTLFNEPSTPIRETIQDSEREKDSERGKKGKKKGKKRGSGITANEHYINEKYYINRAKLNNGILEIRYVKNRHLVPVKLQTVSPLFRDMVLKHLDGHEATDKASFAKLSDNEKHLFRSICKYIDVDGGSLPDPSDMMDKKAQLVFGELRAGNTNPEIKREAYVILRHAYLLGKISSSDFNAFIRNYNL